MFRFKELHYVILMIRLSAVNKSKKHPNQQHSDMLLTGADGVYFIFTWTLNHKPGGKGLLHSG